MSYTDPCRGDCGANHWPDCSPECSSRKPIAYPKKKECTHCDGTGKVYFSCCGDDVKGTIHEDYSICPTCKEHLSGEYEDCEECDGTGVIAKSPAVSPNEV